MPIVSVIIPVYNVSQYLKESLNSVLNQNLKDIEVICVDDGSTDDSLDILNEYAARDNRVKVYFNDRNHGVSYTRNYGLAKAVGEYVHFFDPDDMVKKNMYSEMLNCDADVIVAMYESLPKKNKALVSCMKQGIYTPVEYFKMMGGKINSEGLLCYAWRSLFKLSLLRNNSIHFCEGISMGEDSIFNMKSFISAKSIAVVPKSLYVYRENVLGATRKPYKSHLEQSLQLQIAEKKRLCLDFHLDDYIPFTVDMSEDIVRRYTMMLFNNAKNNPNGESLYEGVKRILNMPMVRDAMNVVGYKNIYSNWKEYLFYLCMKFKMASFVVRFL